MESNAVISQANQMYSYILKNGPSSIGPLFLKDESFSQQIRFNPTEEYIKKMLIAQMKLSSMLINHKYQNQGLDGVQQFRNEIEEFQKLFESSDCLRFDAPIVESLFGNPLDIKTEEEAKEWSDFVYYSGLNGKSYDEIFNEERTLREQEKEKNPFKKLWRSFQYNRITKKLSLEDTRTKKVREIIRKQFQENPENEMEVYKECKQMLYTFVSEYESLRGIDDIARMVLSSLIQKNDGPIDVAKTCEKLRNEFQKNASMEKVKNGYRQRDIILGNENYDQVSFEQVPHAIAELQKRYEEAFNKEQSPEDYVRDLAKIVSDFIYLQPFEDGNKRTAISLFNSMMMSKGLIPPPISITNDYEMGQAFEKSKLKDYDDLQERFVKKYHDNLKVDSSNSERQNSMEIDVDIDRS